ncbi:EGF domain-specific O-linked N-acetylglucosamine transferase [Chionoecetes opilio]|uniref:EGF domain-specific O-linked N-acetylglucosamine transferase n=1 Tax=Chionoecetes opilio TaxID=41210 RepID=A0A8J5CXX0_CHIOP|nr:EGF domain-specific O-linked N-acetylglucosamine transferase [Chionoecetes opilio]
MEPVWAYVAVLVLAPGLLGDRWEDLNLHPEHLPFVLANDPGLAEECRTSSTCPYKMHLNRPACWGHEDKCKGTKSYSRPFCPGDARGWVKSKKEQLSTFFTQADFGFVKERRKEVKVYCQPQQQGDSWLECSDHLEFCRGRNIYMDFRPLLDRKEPVRYHMDVLDQGQVGGHCRLDQKLLKSNADQISPLQSWGPELRHFAEVDKRVEEGADMCDLWIEKPTYLMKIDATVNMYHHFCDFLNLYASQHLNTTHHQAFSRDNQIIIWETLPYWSNFGAAFDAFTKNPLWNLNHVAGKRVCFKSVMFPLLPRMIFGLFYNTPIVWGCQGSGLFHAFSRHLLHRLRVAGAEQTRGGDGRVHVTLLSRDTKYRRVLNERELISALERNKTYIVRRAEYSHKMDFRLQLQQDQWSDIFIGMHGAGLTHLLFMPTGRSSLNCEYNCGDANCYQDLARLRGLKYLTWRDPSKLTPEDEGHHPEGGAHEKFTNYRFNVEEFLALVGEGAAHVMAHKGWRNLHPHLNAKPPRHHPATRSYEGGRKGRGLAASQGSQPITWRGTGGVGGSVVLWRRREGKMLDFVYGLPYVVLELPRLKLKRPSWLAMPAPMTVFAFILLSYFLVAFMAYRVNGQYIMEGLASSFMFALGGIGFILLDQTHSPSTPKLHRILLIIIGFSCIIISAIACYAFMKIKLPSVQQPVIDHHFEFRSVKEALDCPVCLEQYNEGLHNPKMMPCLHTLCASCIAAFTAALTKQSQGSPRSPEPLSARIASPAPESHFHHALPRHGSQSNLSNTNSREDPGAASHTAGSANTSDAQQINAINALANVMQTSRRHPLLRRVTGLGPTSPVTQHPPDPLPGLPPPPGISPKPRLPRPASCFSPLKNARSISLKRPEASPPLPPKPGAAASHTEPQIPKNVVVQCPLCRSKVNTSKLQTNRYILAHMRDIARMSLHSPSSPFPASSSLETAKTASGFPPTCPSLPLWVETQKATLESLQMAVEENLGQHTAYLQSLQKMIKECVWEANKQVEDLKEELHCQPPNPVTESHQEMAEALREKVTRLEVLAKRVSTQDLAAGYGEMSVSLREAQQQIIISTNNSKDAALIITIVQGQTTI